MISFIHSKLTLNMNLRDRLPMTSPGSEEDHFKLSSHSGSRIFIKTTFFSTAVALSKKFPDFRLVKSFLSLFKFEYFSKKAKLSQKSTPRNNFALERCCCLLVVKIMTSLGKLVSGDAYNILVL